MFRIVCDTSSGITELCLTEITRGGSQIFFVCLVVLWQRVHKPQVQNYAAKHRPSTRKISVSHHELFQSSTAQ